MTLSEPQVDYLRNVINFFQEFSQFFVTYEYCMRVDHGMKGVECASRRWSVTLPQNVICRLARAKVLVEQNSNYRESESEKPTRVKISAHTECINHLFYLRRGGAQTD